jgi:hypothetical protein
MSRRWASLKKQRRENGPRGTITFLISRLVNLVGTRGLVPPNTVEANLELWSRYDWSRKGEEWTLSDEWKESLVKHVMEPNIPEGCRVLEIGPGMGRWRPQPSGPSSRQVWARE